MIRITQYARENLRELDPDNVALKIIYYSTEEEFNAYTLSIAKLSNEEII